MPLTVPHFAEASRPPGSRGLAGGRGALHRRPELLSQLADWTSGGDKQAAASLLGYHRQTRAGEARDGAASSAGFPGVTPIRRDRGAVSATGCRPRRRVRQVYGGLVLAGAAGNRYGGSTHQRGPTAPGTPR